MELSASPWSDFATTLFSAEEEKRRHGFLVRNALQFLSAAEMSVVAHRLAQCAIPEIADVSLVALTSSGQNAATDLSLAYRYPAEGKSIAELKAAAGAPVLREIFRRLTSEEGSRALRAEEQARIQALLPGFSVHSGIIARIGSREAPLGHALYLMTASGRGASEARVRLIRDLMHFAEPALQRAATAEHLRQEVHAREQLISIASHELKTPLTAMKLQLDLLRRNFQGEKPRDAAQIEQTFGTLDRTIQKLTQSVGMLFNLAEIQSGHLTLTKEPADLVQVVRDLLQRMQPLLSASNCSVTFDLPASVPGYFDVRRIEQGILNLLTNSVKYAPACAIHLSLDPVSENPSEQWARLRINDNGPGIPEEQHTRIFEAFRRGAEDHQREGLGLGLFVARGAVQAHGGRLSLVSGPGDGARFLLEFPLWLT